MNGYSFNVSFTEEPDFIVDFGAGSEKEYPGPFNVIPAQEQITLPTANRVVAQNIIIEPIPSNYGLITWNGEILTVS